MRKTARMARLPETTLAQAVSRKVRGRLLRRPARHVPCHRSAPHELSWRGARPEPHMKWPLVKGTRTHPRRFSPSHRNRSHGTASNKPSQTDRTNEADPGEGSPIVGGGRTSGGRLSRAEELLRGRGRRCEGHARAREGVAVTAVRTSGMSGGRGGWSEARVVWRGTATAGPDSVGRERMAIVGAGAA